MSFTVLGAAANIFGIITPAKDLGEIIKGIADTVQEVKLNDESTSYWDNTLKDHARDVYTFMIQCKEAGANDSQSHSLTKLLESLIVLRKEIIECSRQPYLSKLCASGNIRRKIESIERKMKHCHDLFVADTLSTHTGMLMQVNKEMREIANREGRNHIVERTAIRWKVPRKADSSDPMVFEYAYLARKSHTLIYELKSNSGYIQERLLDTGHNIKNLNFANGYYPEGSALSECEDASLKMIRACQMLRNRNFSDTFFIEWLTDSEELAYLLFNVGLKKESRQLQEFMCQIWSFLASHRGSRPIYSHLARSLHDLAVYYIKEGRYAEALSLVEQAIQIYRRLGESFLPDLAVCLSSRSYNLRCLDRFEVSLASAQESVGLFRRLVEDNLSLYTPDLVDSLWFQAEALLDLSRPEEALQCAQDALQWLSKVSPRYKQIHSYLYARISWLIAKANRSLGDQEQAMEYGRRALSVFHALIRDRPLFYSSNLSYTLSYTSWSESDHQSALSVLDESLTTCLTVDATFTAPQLADILDRRAAALISSSRCAEALESYDQGIDVRRRLLEDEEDVDSGHFKALLKSFRLRSSCLLSLQRQRDALSSLNAAQDAIVSRLKTEIDEDIKTFIIQELEEEHKLMEGCISPDYIELISSLRSCKKVLSQIQEVKCTCQIGSTARLDLGRLSTLEYGIHVMAGSLDTALMSIQDAIDFYRSQIEQNRARSIRADLVTSLVLHTRCCIRMDRLEQALCSMKDAVNQLRVDLEHDAEGCISRFFDIFDLYSNISSRLLDENDYQQNLRLFLKIAIKILQSPIMTSHTRTTPTLARVLTDKAHLLYNIGSYEEAVSASEKSVTILRRLVAEIEDECHKWDFAFSLYWLARSELATGNTTAAWKTVNDGMDVLIKREDHYCISGLLQDLIFLRGDILFYLGRTPDVHDVLLESLLLEIPSDGDMDSESESDGGDDCEPDASSESGSEDGDKSESESIYESAVDDSDLDDSSDSRKCSSLDF